MTRKFVKRSKFLTIQKRIETQKRIEANFYNQSERVISFRSNNGNNRCLERVNNRSDLDPIFDPFLDPTLGRCIPQGRL